MVANASTSPSNMMGNQNPNECNYGLVASFHHSDSSMSFSLNDFPLYDEATVPTSDNPSSVEYNTSNDDSSCSLGDNLELLSIHNHNNNHNNNRGKKHDDCYENNISNISNSSFASWLSLEDSEPVLDFSSSWPCSKHPNFEDKNNNAPVSENENGTLNSTLEAIHAIRLQRQSLSPLSFEPETTNSSSIESSKSKSKSNTASTKTITTIPKTTTRVRFSQDIEVRTHSLVLGDHPFCEDGLALDLGWDYNDSSAFLSPLAEAVEEEGLLESSITQRWKEMERKLHQITEGDYNDNDNDNFHNDTTIFPRQLSFEERKRLLLEVGECSEAQIEARCFRVKFLLEQEQKMKEQLQQQRFQQQQQQKQREQQQKQEEDERQQQQQQQQLQQQQQPPQKQPFRRRSSTAPTKRHGYATMA